LVRHASGQWHHASDRLLGEDVYNFKSHKEGKAIDQDAVPHCSKAKGQFSIEFKSLIDLWSVEHTEILFSDGACSQWIRAPYAALDFTANGWYEVDMIDTASSGLDRLRCENQLKWSTSIKNNNIPMIVVDCRMRGEFDYLYVERDWDGLLSRFQCQEDKVSAAQCAETDSFVNVWIRRKTDELG